MTSCFFTLSRQFRYAPKLVLQGHDLTYQKLLRSQYKWHQFVMLCPYSLDESQFFAKDLLGILNFRIHRIRRTKVNGFQTLREKLMICDHHQNFSLQFEVNLLGSKLGWSYLLLLNLSFDPSRFTSNWRLKFWWLSQIINFLLRVENPLTFDRPMDHISRNVAIWAHLDFFFTFLKLQNS